MKNKTLIMISSCILVLISSLATANTYYDQQFYNAINDRKLAKVKELVESGKVNIHKLQYYSKYSKKYISVSPFAMACASYATGIAKYLIYRGADVNAFYGYYSALWWATYKGTGGWVYYYEPLIKLMLSKGANPNLGGKYKIYPLMAAAGNNIMKYVKLLLQYGAKRDLKNYKGKTAADNARAGGHIEMANFLNGVSNDAYRNTLFYAAKTGDLKKASNIIKNAGSNLSSLLRKKEKGSTYTALHYAARYGNLEIAKLLISYGAPINMESTGSFTPLHVASAYRKSKVALLLVQFGADPNIVQSSGCATGFTAFYWAVHTSQNDVVKAMWDKGNIKTNVRGRDVIYLIRSVPTLKLLIEYCNVKPSSAYLSYLSKQINGKYRNYYLKYYQYLQGKGYYNDNNFSSSYARRRAKNPFIDGNRRKKARFEPFDIRKR